LLAVGQHFREPYAIGLERRSDSKRVADGRGDISERRGLGCSRARGRSHPRPWRRSRSL